MQEGRFQKLAETQLLKVRTRRRARSEPLDVLPISPFGTLLRCAIRLGSKTGTPVGLWQDALLGRVHSRVTVAECCISLAVAPFNLAARCLCGRAVYIRRATELLAIACRLRLATAQAHTCQGYPHRAAALVSLARVLTRGDAARARAQAEFGEEAFAAQRARAEADKRAARAAAAVGAGDANAIPLGERKPYADAAEADAAGAAPERTPAPPLPAVEWWDARLLLDPAAYEGAAGSIAGNVNEAKITVYVEHPVPIEPPAEGPPPAPMPLMLTAKVTALARRCMFR